MKATLTTATEAAMKRSMRRAEKERMKAKARRLFPNDPHAERLADNLAFCTRLCCRSRRRDFAGPTHRERIFALDNEGMLL